VFALPCLIPVIALTVANGASLPAPSLSNTSPAFDVSLTLDAPLLGASAAMLGASLFLTRAHSGPVATGLRSNLFAIDRIGSFRRRADQDLASTLIMSGLLIGAPLGLALANDVSARSWRPAFLVTESMLVSFALNQFTKSLVNRPRPYTYAEGSASGDGRRSFYSGHTTVSFAAVTSAAYLLHELHPDSSAPLWLGGLGLLSASAVGALRVTSGRHFPSDVAVGALTGVGIGLAVPWLHKRNRSWGISVGLDQVGVFGTF
jgi:undecaprenyl-diphosphatase